MSSPIFPHPFIDDIIGPKLIIAGLFLFILLAYPIVDWLLQATEERNRKGEVIARIPPRYPVIGHLYDLLPEELLHTLQAKHRHYGPNFDLFLLHKRHRVIGDIETVKELLLKRPKVFRRPRSFELPFTLLGVPTNLFAAEGSTWSRARRLTAPHFSKQNVVRMFDVLIEEVTSFLDRLMEHYGDGRTVVEMDFAASNFTNRVIGRVAIGLDPTAADSGNYFTSDQLTTDVRLFLEFGLQCALFPLPHWAWKYHPQLKALETDALTASHRFDLECVAHVQAVRRKYVQAKEKAASTTTTSGGASAGTSACGGGGHSLIESLLQESDRLQQQRAGGGNSGGGLTAGLDHQAVEQRQQQPQQHQQHYQQLQEGITDSEVVEAVKIMLIAGGDTTSVTIAWAMFLLSQSPQWCDIIREEVDKQVGVGLGLGPGGGAAAAGNSSKYKLPCSAEEASRLVLTSAFIKETLRLYSPSPFIGLELVSQTESYTCSSNGMVILPQDQILINIDGNLTNPEVFSNPDAFDPMRWVSCVNSGSGSDSDSDRGGAAGSSSSRSSSSSSSSSGGGGTTSDGVKVMQPDSLGKMEQAFIVFGGGPRVCPGMGLAYMEATVAVAALISQFEVELACPPEEVVRTLHFVAKASKVPVYLTPRHR